MATKLSSPCNSAESSSFSESEMDVARQLIQLCGGVEVNDDGCEGNSEKLPKRKLQVDDHEDDVSSLKPRKRFRSINYIYSSTKKIAVN
ncbi:hypothetical protein SLE2022_152600 [Rubroshorea leprosula]